MSKDRGAGCMELWTGKGPGIGYWFLGLALLDRKARVVIDLICMFGFGCYARGFSIEM